MKFSCRYCEIDEFESNVVTHRADSWWHTGSCSLYVNMFCTVHVNLAGCQLRLRVVKKKNDVWVSSEQLGVCRPWKKLQHVLEDTRTRTRTHRERISLHSCPLTHLSCSKVWKRWKAPPAKSLPKLPQVSFYVCSGVIRSEGLCCWKPDPAASHRMSKGVNRRAVDMFPQFGSRATLHTEVEEVQTLESRK